MACAPPPQFYRGFPIAEFALRVNRAVASPAVPPFQCSSWWRSPQHNAEVGGEPYSQHLVGLAVDLATSRPEVLGRELRAQGLYVVEYPTHVHAQAWPAGTLERYARTFAPVRTPAVGGGVWSRGPAPLPRSNL